MGHNEEDSEASAENVWCWSSFWMSSWVWLRVTRQLKPPNQQRMLECAFCPTCCTSLFFFQLVRALAPWAVHAQSFQSVSGPSPRQQAGTQWIVSQGKSLWHLSHPLFPINHFTYHPLHHHILLFYLYTWRKSAFLAAVSYMSHPKAWCLSRGFDINFNHHILVYSAIYNTQVSLPYKMSTLF